MEHENTEMLLKLSSLLGKARSNALQHARNARRAGEEVLAAQYAKKAARCHDMSRSAYKAAFGR